MVWYVGLYSGMGKISQSARFGLRSEAVLYQYTEDIREEKPVPYYRTLPDLPERKLDMLPVGCCYVRCPSLSVFEVYVITSSVPNQIWKCLIAADVFWYDLRGKSTTSQFWTFKSLKKVQVETNMGKIKHSYHFSSYFNSVIVNRKELPPHENPSSSRTTGLHICHLRSWTQTV